MRVLVAALALAGSMLAAPAGAQQGGTVRFSVGTVNYVAPMPASYCAPATPDRIRSAEDAAALDKNNLTNLTLDSCGSAADPADYMIVKTPIDLVSAPMALSDILKDPEFARVQRPQEMPETDRAMEAAFLDRTGRAIDLSGGTIGLGHDEVCGYQGGWISVAAGGAERHYSMGGCITVVGNRVLSVFFYGPGDGPGTVRRLMAKARAFALTISVSRD